MSTYPEFHFTAQPEYWEDQKWMIEATISQVEKDFRLQAIEISMETRMSSYKDMVADLAQKLDMMEFAHHSRFVSVLYQIDLSQKEITEKMARVKPELFYFVLADEILKRCFLKVYWRNRMKNEESD